MFLVTGPQPKGVWNWDGLIQCIYQFIKESHFSYRSLKRQYSLEHNNIDFTRGIRCEQSI